MTIRCTRRLARHVKAEAANRAVRIPTTRLGDWYANLLFTQHRRLIICVSERSLLPVIVAAKDRSAFSSRLREAIRSVLGSIGVPSDALNQEIAEMGDATIGLTASRSVLGSLNDFALGARFALEEQPDMDLLNLAVELAETPCSPLKYANPRSVTLGILR